MMKEDIIILVIILEEETILLKLFIKDKKLINKMTILNKFNLV
jgi:hypothetical protein